MTISFEKPQINRDWMRPVMRGILAAIEATPPVGPNIHNIVLQLNDALTELVGSETDTPSNRAWNWAARTLTYASGEILAQSRRLAPLSANNEKSVEVFLDAATQFGDAQLDKSTLRVPSWSSVFEPARDALPDLLLTSTTGQNLDLDTLKTRFDRALQAASNRVICENPAYFKPLEDALVGVGGELARREADWARHNFWVSAQFTDEPVFSPGTDETVPLATVYLRLRCFWNEEISIETDESERQGIRRTAHVSNLHETLHEWLKGSAGTAPLRVVAGGPGCGKSSFARAFAHELMQDTNKHRVALIRLQHTHLTGQLDRDIAAYFHKYNTLVAQKGNPGLPQSPLEWRKDDVTPLLLIFDGLDELTANSGDAEKYANEFLLSLMRMLQPLNADGPPVRALVLGRNIACEQAMEAAGLPLPTLLNVAPIAPVTRETCGLDANRPNGEQDLFDPDGLMQKDQRETYWKQWAQAKGLDPDSIPEPVTHASMSALNLEPLLLHLLIISKYCGTDWERAADNRNLVYEDILEKIYERNCGKGHFATHNITRNDFFDLMDVLGLAAWRGNGRTGSEEEFRTVRKLHLQREKHFQKIGSASLKSIALNIHTRPGGNGDDDGFEFIHKSLGEFLAARGLLSHTCKLADKLAEGYKPAQEAESWTKLVAGAELTPYIIRFLYDEVRRRLAHPRAAKVKDGLTKMLDWVIEYGLPVPKAFPSLNWRNLETYQRCAESALLAVACASASVIPLEQKNSDRALSPTVNINTSISPETAIALVCRLIFTPNFAVRLALTRINLSGADLVGADLRGVNLCEAGLIGATLREANLSEADLIGADLRGADLRGANLRAADLIGADLRGANLSEADLRGADLSEAGLIGADLRGANLRAADLIGADLRWAGLHGANLSVANLSETNLREAGLIGANLRGANLCGANLRWANLRGASLREAGLIGANLRGADLRRSNLCGAECSRVHIQFTRLHSANLDCAKNLTQASINSALGDEETKLPNGLKHPAIWMVEAD
ncbi:pentapeptide repeat-containing protein [Ruegeria sp. HKCCD8929]|uniref:pentapeptide repeat-containing protein n=1 Tax=Ruegeria sp. HKCCD8929 TaxID=2683006 RepID=UPI001487B96A|nr:pentapeptide repeat-containing protein [Ruegeria sp. HKCCD8929]